MGDGTPYTANAAIIVQDDEVTTVNGGAVAASKVQRIKVDSVGADGAHRDTSTAFPFPVAVQTALPTGANVIGGVTVADVTASGTLTAAAQTVVLSMTSGMSAASAQITGTWVGTITFEGTVDGTNWVAVNGVYAGSSTPGSTITANGVVRLTPGGLTSLRLNMTAFTSGSAVVTMRGGRGAGGTFLNQSLTAGANIIGKVGIDQTTPGTTNAVVVTANSLVSTVNSTSANLGVGAVFTGTSEDVSEYSMINATVFASHASATDGLSLQQSSDGTNWDMVDAYTIPAATGKTFSIAVNAKFYRLVYTNGATLTTSLRIQTIHSKSPKKGSSMRPQDARGNDNDMEEMASYLSLYNGTSWDRARGTIANGLAVDVTRMPSASATYSAAIVGLATAITATDIFTITGSATKTVRVSKILVNGVQTTAAQVNILIIKRSTANSAGTSSAPTRVPYDSTNAAVTATVLAYTANPTLGTAVGTASASRAFIPGAATASDAQGLEIISGDVGQQMMTLRGIAEVLAVNLNSTTVAGSALNITIEWTES